MIKNKSIEILEKNKCSGCNACFSICPTKAINMEYDEEGFLYPIVTHNKCTNCGLCSKICPEISFEFINEKPICYAMQAIDDVRNISSSGGIFTLLSDYLFDNNGYVCGVQFNENFEVEHTIINDRKDLYKLRGSKYVQSNKNNIFSEIKKLLNNDKLVLFTGCPCEVSGLKNFLQKDYYNLITVDLLCGSVQSPKIWEKYLKDNFDIKTIKNITFRDKKSFGWVLQLNVYFKDGTSYNAIGNNNSYCKLYSSHILERKCCSKCKYSSFPRVGDITIGDFWGIDQYDSNTYDSNGTSMILVNNKKGKSILNKINYNNISLLNKFDFDSIGFHPNGKALFHRRNGNISKKRSIFYKKLKLFSFNKVIDHFFDNKSDVGIVGFNGSTNYGSILNTYSVYKILESLGYITTLISYLPGFITPKFYYNKKFHDRYFSYTKRYKNIDEMYELNKYIDIFVSGSDQIFRYTAENWDRGDIVDIDNIFYLSFVQPNKKLISFASSFGHNVYEGNFYNKIFTKYCLNRFDHLSVREESGQQICKNIFNINTELIIEPVFFLDRKEFDNIILDSNLNHKGKLAYYILDPSPEKDKSLQYIAKKLNLEIIDAGSKFQNEVEDFLYIMKNADFIFTDSFHGTCFASIFRKNFISIKNKNRGESRYFIFDKFGINNHIICNLNEIKEDINLLLQPINYSTMDRIIHQEREKAILWLKKSLESKKNENISDNIQIIDFLLKKINTKNSENRKIIDSLLNEVNTIVSNNNNSSKIINRLVNNIAWWIPIKKWRDNFRNKILYSESRAEQSRAEQSRAVLQYV
ncbi:polysaccharide pyruvyl transferase family protein [Brachyspira murdochii]|uniref:polysaccharide pyruvyl transferase family protein n=1 Tax=Brachyspira murdochii TaxID=84378 RepID=UPI0012F490A7|nr:polysaccharide pyruvyl transferase family protein [Brachyspira murdochii]